MEIFNIIDNAKKQENIGNIDEAILILEKAILTNPDNKDLIMHLSRLYLTKGKPLKSLELLNSKTNMRNDPDFLMQLATVYMFINCLNDAEITLKEALQYTQTGPIYNNLGVILLRLGKGSEAVKSFEKSIELEPGNINAWLNIATYYHSQNNIDLAIEILTRALSNNDKNFELIQKYVELLNLKGDSDKALSIINNEEENYSNNIYIKLLKIKTLFTSNKLIECKEEIDKIENELLINANNKKEIFEIKEQLYFKLGDIDKSLSIIEELINMSNSDIKYILRKAYILLVASRYKESLETLSNILNQKQLHPNIRNEAIILMKNVEIENWKHLVKLLISDQKIKDLLVADLNFGLNSLNILLPDEGLLFLRSTINNIISNLSKFIKPPMDTIS